MFVIPAIDLQGGECVRLREGKITEKTVYSASPAEVARRWAKLGAKRLHVVDLDGAFSGECKNFFAVQEILQAVDLPIQYGGGVREMETLRILLSMGIERVVLGTVAVENPAFVEESCDKFPGRIVVGVDVKDGRVAVKGWTEGSLYDAREFVREMERRGADRFVFTDVSRDGTLSGPNFAAIDEFLTYTSGKVIASGGVGSIADIEALALRKERGLEGVIVGKALYDGRVDLEQAAGIGD